MDESTPLDLFSEAAIHATRTFEFFEAFQTAGFSEVQAFRLTSQLHEVIVSCAGDLDD